MDGAVIRASSLGAFQDCQLRAAAHSAPGLFAAHGWALLPSLGSIGALIGSGVHAGAEVGLRERLASSTALVAVSTLEDAGIDGFRARLADEAQHGLVLDEDSPSPGAAEAQVRRLLRAYRADVIASAHPLAVERRIEAALVEGVTLSGQADLLHLDEPGSGLPVLRDLKTGRRREGPLKHLAQIGTYSLLFRSRGWTPAASQIDFLQRVRADRPQPAVEAQPLPLEPAEQIAHAVATEFGTKLLAFSQDGDPARFLPNPTSRLCSPRFCRLFGTAACPATKEASS